VSGGPGGSPNIVLRAKRAKPKRHALTNSLLGEARAALASKKDASFAIDNPRGLSIRVRNEEIAYYVQARGPSAVVKRKICSVGEAKFSEIKKIAANAVAAIKNGRDVDTVIASGLAKKSAQETEIALDGADGRAQDLWTLGIAIDEYMARTVIKNGVQTPKLSAPSIREIKDRLREKAEAQPLMNRFVKELRLDDFEKIRDKLAASGGGRSSPAKFVDLSKRIFDWSAKYHRRRTGLDPALPWWRGLAYEYKSGDRSKRYLTPLQVGMLLALLEGVRALEHHTSAAVFGALQLVWMTVQRSGAVVGMQALNFGRWVPDPVEERAGWHVFSWSADEVKGKRECKLSIPPVATAILERVANNAKNLTKIDSMWAFPQARNVYLLRAYANSRNEVGIRQLDKHITESALNHALDALAGRKPGWKNLLQMVGLPDRIGPHDSRRSATTFFENRGQGSYASALLDHKVSGSDKMSERVAAVTQGVYSAADRIPFKAEALQIWLAAILPHYERAKADPRLKAAIEARRASLEQNKKRGLEKRAKTLEAKRNQTNNEDTSKGWLVSETKSDLFIGEADE
jgi:hypothetical protein